MKRNTSRLKPVPESAKESPANAFNPAAQAALGVVATQLIGAMQNLPLVLSRLGADVTRTNLAALKLTLAQSMECVDRLDAIVGAGGVVTNAAQIAAMFQAAVEKSADAK